MIPLLRIKEVRTAKELSQFELAQKANMSQSYLSELENNLKSPTLRQLCKIAEALNVHPDTLWFIIYE